MRKREAIIKGTLILTISGLIARLLGFVNRIYLSNLIGAEGMGLYQLVFPIYMICYTICCSGLFTAISRLTAEENAKSNPANTKKLLFIATSLSLFLGILSMVILYLSAESISINLYHDPRITMGLQVIAISIPFTAVMQSIKGYFYGLNESKIPAITQVVEQIVRISAIYFLSSFFVPKGLDYACLVAVIGMALGDIVSTIIVLSSYYKRTKNVSMRKATKTLRYYTRKISNIAIPLTSHRLITTLLTSIETILIPTQLKAFGYSHSFAISIYGTLTGMALPLIFFPTVVTSAASLMLLPAISDANARKQKAMIQATVTKTIQLTLLMGIIFTFFFLAFGKELGTMIYNEEYVGQLLVTLSFICPFLYLQHTLGSILNGLDKHLITFRDGVIGLSIRIIFIFLFIPVLGLEGYLLGLIVSLIAVTVLHIHTIIKVTNIEFRTISFIIKPVLCSVGSMAAINLIGRYWHSPYGQMTTTLIYICLFFIILVPVLISTKTIDLKDFKQ